MRRPVGAQGDRFAVEDDLACGQRACRLDDFRHGDADVAQVARVDTHVVAGLVHLDARAIELVFERRLAKISKSGFNVRGRVGEHRLDRRERLDDQRLQRRFAFDERRPGDRRERAGEHRRAPDGRRRDLRRARDGFDEHALECALAKLAKEETRQEVLLGFGGALEQASQRFGSRPGRP